MKQILNEWRKFLNEVKEYSIIAHLTGQAGSGKTHFVENTLLRLYPEIVAKDLDDFDDEADEVVSSGKGDKSWRQSGDPNQVDQKLAREHFDTVQGLINQFISENSNKKIFLSGMSVFPWVQGINELNLGNPQMKIYLEVDPQVSTKRRIARDIEKGLYGDSTPTKEEFEAELEWAAEEKAQLLSSGYKPKTPEEIVKSVDDIMKEEKNETNTK